MLIVDSGLLRGLTNPDLIVRNDKVVAPSKEPQDAVDTILRM
jgi:hypothetical protein